MVNATTDARFAEFVWIWNALQNIDTPEVHRKIADWLDDSRVHDRRRLLLMAFRACGKSTLVGLYCAWLLSRDPNIRILVLAAEQDLATKMVRNVKRIIERHPLTRGLKPKRTDEWASDRFTVKRPGELRDPSMLARGIGANLTGSRADVVICDDVEVPNTCDTQPKRLDLRQRLSELDYILVPGGQQIYVGTPHNYYTIYADTPRPEMGEDYPFLNGFERLILPILQPDGSPQWPGRYTPEAIAELRLRHGEAKFQSQMMLQPTGVSGFRLDPDQLVEYDAQLDYRERNGTATISIDGNRMVSASAWWDPAYGGTDAGDGSVVACVFTDAEGVNWLHDIEYLRVDMTAPLDEARQQCRAVARFVQRNMLPSVTVETNGIGRFLPGLLRSELQAMNVSCAVLESYSTRSKETRILEAFEVRLAARQLKAHLNVLKTPFAVEMREWSPQGKAQNHDDGLDAVAGCLLSEAVRLPTYSVDAARASWRGLPVAPVETEFDV